MSLFINTNIASLYAQNNVANSQSALALSIQRLSSGLRINSAKDDAAGMAIAARMTSQIGGMTQAAQNANDGISLSQTAEGALAQVTNDLQTMRNLSVQAANGTNSAGDRASLQASIAQLQNDISQIAANTQYNGLNLLDGSLANVQFQIGANAGQVINASVGNASANAIGDNYASSATAAAGTMLDTATTATSAIGANNFAAQTLTLSVSGQTLSTGNIVSGTSAFAIAQQVNSLAASSGAPLAAVAHTYAKLSNFAAAGAVSLTLKGAPAASGAANPVTISATMSTAKDTTSLAAAINAVSSKTGISAVADSVNGTVSLVQNAGYDIGVSNNAGSAGTVNFSGADAAGAVVGTAQTLSVGGAGGGAAAVMTGGNITSMPFVMPPGITTNVTVNGVLKTITLAVGGPYVDAFAFAADPLQVAAFAAAGLTLSTASATQFKVTNNTTGAGSTLTVFSDTGPGGFANFFGLDAAATIVQGSAGGTNSSTVGGQVDFHSSSSFAVTSTNTTLLATTAAGTSGLQAVNSVDVTKITNGIPTGANTALFIVDNAINTVNGLRADLGALQNRFLNAQSSLNTTSTNMQQARSRIQDTDFAAETANLTHNQILQQAGTAMLAQANALPNSVLTLLR